MRIARILSLISVCFEIDGILKFTWGLALWPVWSFLGLIGIVTFGIGAYCIGNVCTFIISSSFRLELLSSLWLFGVSLGGFISFIVFFMSVTNSNINFTVPCVFLGCFVLSTSMFYKELQVGLTKCLFDNEESYSGTLPNQTSPIGVPNFTKTSIKSKIYRILKSPPTTLIQLSSSYFKPIKINDIKPKKRAYSQIIPTSSITLNKRWASLVPQNKTSSREINLATLEPDKCLMCLDKDANAVFMDCGHGGICHDCARKLQDQKTHCHICRGPIIHVLKVSKVSGDILKVIN
jgi:Zinc finger, C3HC4 type (RING finger)